MTKDYEIEEGREVVRRTIVGGRPMDRRRRKVRIPIGIEKVLCRAAADREFREQLLMARADALTGTDLEVSGPEAMILASVSEDALRTMIENIDLKRHRKRRFFRGIAAASLAATTATISLSCDIGSLGIDPVEDVVLAQDHHADQEALADEFAPSDVIDQDTAPSVDAGSWPELPPVDAIDVDVIEGHDGFAPGGVMPDTVDEPADVIDSETAMDGGMWADDVKDEE